VAEEQSKRIDELVEQLQRMGRNIPIDTVKPIVDALKVHGELIAVLAKSNKELVSLNQKLIDSNEKLLNSFEKTERWTKAIVLLTFALVFAALIQLVTLSNVQLSFWQTLAVVMAVSVLVGLMALCIGTAWGMLALPKRRG
jgi:hypothetical protein